MTRIQHLSPAGLTKHPAFSHAVSVSGPHRVVYVGGQDAVDESGVVIGRDDMDAQARQVFRNLKLALAAAGARLEHVVKWTVYVVQGQPLEVGFGVFQEEWGGRPSPPVVTVVQVAGLARPDLLLEIDAVAVVPE